LNAQWVQQNSGTTQKLTDVVMLDSTTAIAVGKSGSILKTTNSGKTWLNKLLQRDPLMSWNCVSFFNELLGIVAGDSYLMTTTDGGEDWQFRSISGKEIFLCAEYRDPYHISVGDDSGYLYHSVDTGKTWSSERLTTGPIKSIFYYALPFMSWRPTYALTSYSVYSTKTSAFIDWREEHLPITSWGAATNGNNFKGGDPAFIVGYDGQLAVTPVILRKTFPDTSWQEYGYPPPMPIPIFRGGLNDVAVPTSSVAFACGDYGLVVKTIDSGAVWSLQSTGISRNLNAIDFYNEHIGFAVGDSGTILFTSSGGVTDVGEDRDLFPTKFELFQNYPNPFNPATTISFSLPSQSFVSLKVFDALGREVSILLEDQLPAGTYARQWIAAALPSGVYFYRLVANALRSGQAGSFTETKKLVLLK
jgi:hypothetical protein